MGAVGAATATTDWEALVADPEIQALLISATPETLHYPMAKAALEAGKHVLLEKPIALTLEVDAGNNGWEASFDNVQSFCEVSTPVQSGTWGAIKSAFYR